MRRLIRSVWNEPRPPDPPARVWRDWVLAGVLVAVAVLEAVVRPDLPWRAVAVTLTIGLVPTVLWRRTRPLLMIVIIFAATGLAPLLTGGAAAEMYTMAYMLILVYALFRWGSGRSAVIGLSIMLGSVSLSILLGRLAVSGVIAAFAVMSAAIALGVALRFRARARLRELDQVKLLEREQLARDLHDTVAHHISAMAIRAQAGLATSAARPDAAADALHVIEAEAARALDEMRAMVRVLRQDQPADLEPGRGIADLEQLSSHSASGPDVHVEISGDLHDLPPSVGSALYRLAQESITNARRHARHATRIEVRVAADDTSVHLRVSDDGESSLVRRPPGYGLIGMMERADLLGGTCTAGPGPNRGWTVTAVLPRAGAAT
ncbi:histidine kinase [Nonomuraea glycinis]|uniref:histidine kinase n=1 Tax=Nonomuraea glycinis TaxID=2047744 RepID=A0A918E7H4_9ACTN|nr:histidine kinase [Nonomuraea glycinis]MCA2178273.1 histidine kinase [Nonomuraea glycinis]GGP12601.1 two-component sensor histidine kinase [Nonomuraea glycinis]